MIAVFCLRNVGERDHLDKFVLDGKITLECILNKLDKRLWIALFWLVSGTNGEMLYSRLCAFGGFQEWWIFLDWSLNNSAPRNWLRYKIINKSSEPVTPPIFTTFIIILTIYINNCAMIVK